ncbi:hypothetical protein [Sanguibacteroides justesenii]|uniref:DUF4251 domain-containing protein n=1 Tax=Sanguibacteroides justesenii TaxID=1547597 RepID=A0AB34R495_9PORP|nr:hypothetical protein [Sanguibacteroides justesenii]KIO43301.1 hypothetical protein IE90_14010 [Sanguibacteroides justesenii]PXZ42827.1 hypothetical protein DMB45_13435 [Sanguibacteroides justesenii]
MKFVRVFLLIVISIFGVENFLFAGDKEKKDNAASVAGVYEGTAFVEIMQQEMELKLELIRIHKDSVIVKVTNFVLPNGQKFNYRSQGVSVKSEIKQGKTIYNLYISFSYNYNGMPMEVKASGKVIDGQFDSEVKATIMQSMETKVTYKAKKQKK